MPTRTIRGTNGGGRASRQRSVLGRLVVSATVLSLLPGGVLLTLLLVSGLVSALILVGVVAGGTTSSMASDFYYQCDSAVGPDPAVTATVPTTVGPPPGDELLSTELPTANPYVQFTIDPRDQEASDWQRDCVSAMASAPYQLPPLQLVNTGAAASCARALAIGQLGRSVGAIGAAVMSRNVIYQASAVAVTGQCGLLGAAPGDSTAAAGGAGADLAPESGSCTRATRGVSESAHHAVVLPATVAAQGLCGQRVEASAVSAGDLVFWDFREHAATRVGVAINSEEVVTADPTTGRVVQVPIPTAGGARVKRVLSEGE